MDGAEPAIELLRRSIAGLPESGAALFTEGVLSVRIPGTDLVAVKPAGAPHESLADAVVVMALSGEVIDGVLAPAAGGDAHATIYRNLPAVGAIVNTRSTLAMASAARGRPVPAVAGTWSPIPIGYAAATSGPEDAVGLAVVDTVHATGSSAVLVRSHGLFTVGANPNETLWAATLHEQRIRTLHIARNLGTAEPLNHQDLTSLPLPSR